MKSVIQLACKPSINTLLACGLISNSLRFEVIGYCSTYARGIFASRGREKNMGELLRDSMVVSTLLKMSCSHFIIRKKTPKNIPPYDAYLAAVNLHYRRPSSISASKIPHLTENCDWFRVKA